jgi:hypothetical protein
LVLQCGTANLSDVLGRASIEGHLVAEGVGIFERGHWQVWRHEGPGVVISIHQECEGKSKVVLGFVKTNKVLSCHVLDLLHKRGEPQRFELRLATGDHTTKIGTNMPVVHLTMEGVALSFKCANFVGSKGEETTGSKDQWKSGTVDDFGTSWELEEDWQDPKRQRL